MISKNVSGNAISSGFITEVRSASPDITGRLWFDGAELDCDIVNITVEKGSCGSGPFMIGAVIGDQLKATVKDLNADIKGKVIECHIGALVNGDYEYISLGKFTVSDVKNTRYQSEIIAYSGIVANSAGDFDASGLTSPTIAGLAIRLQSDLNCTITFDTGIDTTQTVTAQLTGISDWQALQILATCCGGYAINTIDGDIVVKKYSAVPTVDVDTDMMLELPEISDRLFRVRNVGVMVSEATTDNEGSEVEEIYYTLPTQEYIKVIKQGNEYYLEDSNGNRIIANARPELADLYIECAYMTEDIFDANIRQIAGYEYYPATIELALGDPRIEGSDVLRVEEVDGSLYAVPCHRVIHTYAGGFSTEVITAEASDEANDIGAMAPMEQKLQLMRRQTGRAQATADNAYRISGATKQHFWFWETIPSGADPDVGTGAHISEVSEEDFNDPNSPYYHSGGNLLARSNGIAVRDGLTELATFGANGVTIGKNISGESRTIITADGMHVYRKVYGNDTPIADLGYGAGINSQGQTFDAPYYTFGTRYGLTPPIGNYSVAEGIDVTASSYCAHAEGADTFATGRYSHAEGHASSATGHNSHAEGVDTLAEGVNSHAEGYYTKAYGSNAHAQNKETIARGDNQTVIGKYNTSDYTSALIIGNGEQNNRSNALTVDWDGNITIDEHTSAIGTVKHASLASNQSVNNNANTSLVEISLDKGVWVVVAGLRWAQNSAGYRKLNISTSPNASDQQMCVAPVDGNSTQMVFQRIISVSADNTTYYLNGLQTSGNALNAMAGGDNWGTYITAVRII